MAQKNKESVPACTSLGCKTGSIVDPAPPKDYRVADHGEDQDIKASLEHLNDAEKIHGTWTLPPKNETDYSLSQGNKITIKPSAT